MIFYAWAFLINIQPGHVNEIAESRPNLNAERPNVFNLRCLVAQTVALRCLQCNNACLHIHSTGIFSAGSRCCLIPAASSVSHSSVRKALYISLRCALSIPLLLFPSCLQKDSTVRVSNGRKREEVKQRVPLSDLETPFFFFFLSSSGSSLSLSWFGVAMATVKCNRARDNKSFCSVPKAITVVYAHCVVWRPCRDRSVVSPYFSVV